MSGERLSISYGMYSAGMSLQRLKETAEVIRYG
jgi:hypothetical protein